MRPLLKTAALLTLGILPLGGCVAAVAAGVGAAAGAGTYAYVNGKSTSTQKADIDKTWAAAEKTMQDMQFTVKASKKDETTAKLYAQKADGTDVHVTLDRKGPELTEVSVRVGVFGDERESRAILESIGERLGDSRSAMLK
jgi:Protein of unknown function (DUF3568)